MKYIKLYSRAILTILVLLMTVSFAEVRVSAASSKFTIEDGVLVKYSGKDADVAVPDGVKKIGANAFAGNKYIKTVTLPESVKSIANAAFYDCWRLRSVNMLGKVTSIGKFAFCGCEALSSINLPDTVKSIGEDAFVGCSFQSIKLPEALTTIQPETFLNCARLKSIVIPSKVNYIGVSAFEGCESLAKIFIPLSVVKISVAFPYYKGTLQIYYEGKASDWKKIKIYKSAKVWDSAVKNKTIDNAVINYEVTTRNPFLDLTNLKDTPLFKYMFANRVL